ncbi:MAG: ester cyclase [Acidobacteriota bacterium]
MPTTTELTAGYFAAVGRRDLEDMIGRWKPGGRSRIVGVAELTAPDGNREWFGALFRAFPDFEMKVESIIAEDNRASVHWSATGTFSGTGKFEGLKPNGARVEIEGIDHLTIEDGQIQQLTAVLNAADLARQLGAMPPTGSVAEKAMLGAFNAKTSAVNRIRDLR